MRNIPVDTSKLTFVVVSAPRPRVMDRETGEIKIDREGRSVYQVGLSAADESGRVDLLTVSVSGAPDVTLGQIVSPAGLVGFTWEQRNRDGEVRWGIAFRAESISPARPAAIGPLPAPDKAA
jgi:hypothetical protein